MILKFLIAFLTVFMSEDYAATLPDGTSIKLLVADSGNEREVGLMYRQHLEDDEGMIFVFDENRVAKVWMKNTYIPLDVVFLDENNTVSKTIENAEPKNTDLMSSDKPIRYFIELNAGEVSKHMLVVGDRIEIKK